MIIGDVDQLPSIGPCAVLADIIDSRQIAMVRLTEIFRQASISKIITNAHIINQGQLPQSYSSQDLSYFYCLYAESPEEIFANLMHIVLEHITQRFNLESANDVRVFTPMNRGGLGARYLNIELQSRLNGLSEPKVTRYGSTYAPGDKVIQRINNYDKEVFKGILALLVPLTWKKVYFKSPMRSASWTTSLMSWMKSTWPMPPVFIRPKDPNIRPW